MRKNGKDKRKLTQIGMKPIKSVSAIAFMILSVLAEANPITAEELFKKDPIPASASVKGRITSMSTGFGNVVTFNLDGLLICEMTLQSKSKIRAIQSFEKVVVEKQGTFTKKISYHPVRNWVNGNEITLNGVIKTTPSGKIKLIGGLSVDDGPPM